VIKHVVVAAARSGTPDADVDELVAAWRAPADRISDVESLTVGRDLGLGDGRFTLAAVVEFSSTDAETLAAARFEL
jgi:Stress responsive A/B Barrel Domain